MKKVIAILFLTCFVSHSFAQPPKGKIIFSSQGVSGSTNSELYIINSDGSNEHRLTNSNKKIGFSDHFHDRVVYMQTDSGALASKIMVTGMNGGAVKTLIDKGICDPKWSPNGKLIAYEYYPGKAQEIWVMDSSGKNKHRLVSKARHPYWSADGRMLLFTRNYEVFSFDLQKHTERQLTHMADEKYLAKWPAISPDGKKIAFLVYDASGYPTGIMIVDLKTNSQKLIADCDIPYWTSDNKYVVCSYGRTAGKNSQIAIVNIETGEKTFVTHSERYNDSPEWISEQ